ncbi:hypothetical protein GC722_09365 [Auraticoccus sp. F435]|uniref:Leucine-rich repeat domain-containing protein n=1 Tax=Auraticoccus cholistanensis TaxID=2656650 RepID=A0A6A9UU81_9ACTN|nr:hypothetical protein [Auraticoccus cholistanensis]MVA76231.1 hypothetical protein [Auraticoccus cholistanensis]
MAEPGREGAEAATTPGDVGHGGFAAGDAVQARRLTEAELAVLLERLREQDDLGSRFLVAAADRGGLGAVGDGIALLARVDRYSHVPGVLKGMPKVAAGDVLVAAALEVVDDPRTAEQHNGAPTRLAVPLLELWALAALAVRADPAVADRLAEALEGDYVAQRIPELRRSGERATRSQPSTATAPEPGVDEPPQKVSQVKEWLRQHPDPDPEVLAPRPRQKAAAVVAAVRALGTIATPAALDVMTRYATDQPSSALLTELHRAWPRFDRRTFAAAVFLPRAGGLDLDVCSDLTGIDAVAGLRRLRLVVLDELDLAPLAGCTALQELTVLVNGSPGVRDITPLTALPELRALTLVGQTAQFDLGPLARLPLTRLRLSLDGAEGSVLTRIPSLRRLSLSGADGAGRVHPQLAELVLSLVAAGVEVALYRHEHQWVDALVEGCGSASDVHVAATNGKVGLTRDPDRVADLERALYLNTFH